MKFSIVTIAYNSKVFIEKTICSVLSQKEVDLEYILIDGGSTDGTVGLIKGFARSDRRIKWVSERDAGISDAMNKGIRMATGDIIAHLHSDDFYPHPLVLKNVASAFGEGGPWVTGGMLIVGAEDEVLADIKVRDFNYNNLLRENSIYHPSTFVKRKCFECVGLFETNLRYAMDYDLWLRLSEIAAPVLLDEPLSCFRAHSSSLSTVCSDAAYAEAWSVRKRYLGRNPFRLLFHYFRFLRSRGVNQRFNKSLLTRMSDEH